MMENFDAACELLADIHPLPQTHYLVSLTHNQLREKQAQELTRQQVRVLGGLSLRTTDNRGDFEYARSLTRRIALREVIPPDWLEYRKYLPSLVDRMWQRAMNLGGIENPPDVIWFDQEHTVYANLDEAGQDRMEEMCKAMYWTCKAIFPNTPVMWYGYPSVAWRWNGIQDRRLYPSATPSDLLSCDLYYRDDRRNMETLSETLARYAMYDCMPFVAIDGAYDIVYGSTPGKPSQVTYTDTPRPTLDRITEKYQLGWILQHHRINQPGTSAWPDMTRVKKLHAIGPMPETNVNAKAYSPEKILWYCQYLRAYARGAHRLPMDWRPEMER